LEGVPYILPREKASLMEFSYLGIYGLKGIPEENLIMVIPETVGQYAHFEDKDGKEIYEGDILEYEYEDPYKRIYVVGVVKWLMRSFTTENFVNRSFYKRGDRIKRTTIDDWWTASLLYYKDVKIIGNIHDTPELIEKI